MKFECEKTLLASAIDGVSRAITNRAASLCWKAST